MTGLMKLGRNVGRPAPAAPAGPVAPAARFTALAVLVGGACGLAVGCATPSATLQRPRLESVATTELMSAELTDAEVAPRVGKPQYASTTVTQNADEKAAPRHRTDRKPGGGFSGYK